MLKPSRRLLVLAAFAVASLLGVGCAGPAPSPVSPTPSQGVPTQASTPPTAPPATAAPSVPSAAPSEADGTIVTVETTGGECVQGACGGTIAIEADGRIHATAPASAELGRVSAITLEGLATEVAQADFGRLQSRPFTDTCPIAFDGQETIYTFTTPSGPVRLDSCKVVVDPADPLFVAVAAALAEATPR
jgi:hypothetical protein